MRRSLNEIIKIYRTANNTEKAEGMKAYMKHKFEFPGLQKPVRAQLGKEFLQEQKATKRIDWEMVWTLYLTDSGTSINFYLLCFLTSLLLDISIILMFKGSIF